MAKEIERKFIVDPAKLPNDLIGIDYQPVSYTHLTLPTKA